MTDDLRSVRETFARSPLSWEAEFGERATMSDSDKLTRRGVLTAAATAAAASAQEKKPTDPPKPKTEANPAPPAKPAVPPKLTDVERLQQSEWLVGVELTPEQRNRIVEDVMQTRAARTAYRKAPIPRDVAPACAFDPTLGEPTPADTAVRFAWKPAANVDKPKSDGELAFSTVAELAALLQKKQVSSVELTKLYLARLEKHDPTLHCVVTKTADLALKRAAAADRERAAGRVRGPLHGIPWGAKDLISYPGYPTTWGAEPFKCQILEDKATVAQKLDDAGAVLVAKLTLGALAEGDKWFGGMTRNPWNPAQGSSGSSAGSASATAAGLVGFSIGSETLGSIVSPCRRCGSTGLRPTFGRVSRFGCMALSWTMDKIGPICRSVEDCALVFAAILGVDRRDPTTKARAFVWPNPRKLSDIRVGYFADGRTRTGEKELAVLKDLGVKLVPIELPRKIPAGPLTAIIGVEAAAAFDDLVADRKLAGINNWAYTFLESQFFTGVDYVRADRLRTLLIRQMQEVMEKVDLYIGGNDLVIANLTGYPTVVMPNGFVESGEREVPTSITFTGRLFGESALLAVAEAYQRATGFHRKRPAAFL